MIVYLSGPISLGDTASELQKSAYTAVFRAEAWRLKQMGYTVISPVDFPFRRTWQDYMRLGIKAVCECDIIALLPDWQLSSGAVLEMFVAKQLGVPVYLSSDLETIE